MNPDQLINNLISFITNSTCAFTAVNTMKEIFKNQGYQELIETEVWNLKSGNYFVTRNDASIIAFQIPDKPESIFHMITSHCDTPSLLLKPNGINTKNNYLKYNVMLYGGLLNYGWLDHPLSIAGRIMTKSKNEFKRIIIDTHESITEIPSVAIHLNDKANSNLDLNMQTDMQPILGLGEDKETWVNFLNQFTKDEILDYDLFLYHKENPQIIGLNKEFLLSPRIDNLTSVYTSLESFLESTSKHINVFCSFNNEEIGSLTKEGAESDFLLDILKRIVDYLNIDLTSTMAKSFIMSSDNTHAIHPNHPELADITGSAYLGKGFTIIKEPTSTTDSYFSSILKYMAKKHHIKVQDATAKNDLVGGSTLSGLSLRHVSVTSIDIGISELAMHSSLELCSTKDIYCLYQIMKVFYTSSIIQKKENTVVN